MTIKETFDRLPETPDSLKFQAHAFDKRIGRPQFLELLTLPASYWHQRQDHTLRSYAAKLVSPLLEKIKADGEI